MGKLTFNEYQRRARETAIYEDTRYLPLALIGEVGELASYIAKMFRGDYAELDRDRIIDELGDILWMTAMLALETGVSVQLGDSWFMQACKPFYFDLTAEVLELARLSGMFKNTNSVSDVVMSVLKIAGHFDACWEDVARRNLDKLASRAERGVIKGNGDER